MDCWFDSGAMPFAQRHYPFENKENFDADLFPADFICEGIDQTRGWFYSLMAISTFIKGRAPYKNVLVNDLILDKHGKKMSKHVGNTVDPFAAVRQIRCGRYRDGICSMLLRHGHRPSSTKTDLSKYRKQILRNFAETYITSSCFTRIRTIWIRTSLDVPYAKQTGTGSLDSFQVQQADHRKLRKIWISTIT